MKTLTKPLLWVALIGSIFAGSLTAVQARVNGQLGSALTNGVLAALISFAVGFAVVAVIVALSRRSRAAVSRLVSSFTTRESPWWLLLGGSAGAFFVTTQSVTVGVIGVSLFMLGVVAGQVSASLVFDVIGVGPGGKVRASASRIVGAGLAVVAVALAVWANLGTLTHVWMVGLAVIGGVMIAWQAGVNGQLNRIAGSGIVAAFANFALGTLTLIVAAALSLLVLGSEVSWPDQVWLYLGGPLGVIFIALSSYFVRLIGVLLIGLANIAGQLIGALLLDLFAPIAQVTLSAGLLAGCGVALLALFVASWRELRPQAIRQQ